MLGSVLGALPVMSWFPPQHAHKGDTIITPILQVQTLRHRKDKTDHRGCKTGFWRGDSVALLVQEWLLQEPQGCGGREE